MATRRTNRWTAIEQNVISGLSPRQGWTPGKRMTQAVEVLRARSHRARRNSCSQNALSIYEPTALVWNLATTEWNRQRSITSPKRPKACDSATGRIPSAALLPPRISSLRRSAAWGEISVPAVGGGFTRSYLMQKKLAPRGVRSRISTANYGAELLNTRRNAAMMAGCGRRIAGTD